MPLRLKARSSSLVASKRWRWFSVNREKISVWLVSWVSFSKGVGTSCPSMRRVGGAPTVMCRSDAPRSCISKNSSLIDIMGIPFGVQPSMSEAVTRIISSTVVTPLRSFRMEHARRLSMPCLHPCSLISRELALSRIIWRMVSVTSKTS